MTPSKSSAVQDRKARRASRLELAVFPTMRVRYALMFLRAKGVLGQSGSRKVSARLDPGLIEAARARIGVDNDTDLLTAALAIAAGDDEFGAWLVTRGARLPADFEPQF
jgi:hypothetical protein